MALRVERHVENGRRVAEFLRKDRRVEWVNYAGFPDSPHHALAQKYLGGRACSLMTFGVKGGFEAGKKFYDALKLVKRLVNLGDAKSLACHPASTTHRQMSAEEQRKAGVKPEMIRLSVGIEHVDDIIGDLDQALQQQHHHGPRPRPPGPGGGGGGGGGPALPAPARGGGGGGCGGAGWGRRPPAGRAGAPPTGPPNPEVAGGGAPPLGGLIVRGTDPGAPTQKDGPSWGSGGEKLVDWAEDRTHSTVWSCLAAHAAVLHLDGIERRPLDDKRFGVFECSPVSDHPLTATVPSPVRMPHSRWNDIPEDTLRACGYRVILRSDVTGVDAFVRQRKSLVVFFQGHPEYEADALLLEYRRDVKRRSLRRPRGLPPPPECFSPDTAAALAALRQRALVDGHGGEARRRTRMEAERRHSP